MNAKNGDLIAERPIKIPQATKDRITREVMEAVFRPPRDLVKWECAIGCSWVHEPPCRADDGVPSLR